jgi:hypothetical protein
MVMLPLAGMQRQAVDEAASEGVSEAFENRYGNHQLAAEYHPQLKAGTYLVGLARV